MKKTGVIVCSNAGLDYIEHEYNIPIFRSVVIFGENEKYDDYTEISAVDFYNRLKNDKKAFPHTAFVAIGKMISTFEEMKSLGYERILCIMISQKLSGLQQAIGLAAKEVSDLEIIVYDSKTLSYPQAYMALCASKMFEENKSIEEVIKKLDFIRENHHMIFAVDTLEFLIKNGRLSKFAGTFAQMLSIRPLLHISKEGAVESLEKTRTSKKARELMIFEYIKEIENKKVIPFLIHANADESLLTEIIMKVKELRSDLTEISIYPLTPVVGSHAGPGTVALGWILI